MVQHRIHRIFLVALLGLVSRSYCHNLKSLVRSASRAGSLSVPAQPVAGDQGNHRQPGLRPEVPSGSITLIQTTSGASLSQICTLCAVMYGFIGLLWIVHTRCLKAERSPNFHTALLCITWGSTSIGMHVLNKGLASSLKAPALISLVQMGIAVGIFGGMSYRQLFEAPRRQLLVWLVVPIFFAAMLCSSMYTYQYISLSLLTVVRNLTPLIVLPIETLVMPVEKRPNISAIVIIAILIMLCGAVMYVGGVKDVSLVGIAFAVANMIIASSDRLIQRRLLTNDCQDLPSSVCAIMNNSVGMIPTIALALATHQISDLRKPERQAMWSDPATWFLLILSGVVGIGICYLGFECQRVITATSFFVLQNVSKVFVVACGIIFFHDPMKTPLQIFGLLLSLSGSFLYGRAQLVLADQQKKADEPHGSDDAVKQKQDAKA